MAPETDSPVDKKRTLGAGGGGGVPMSRVKLFKMYLLHVFVPKANTVVSQIYGSFGSCKKSTIK